MTLIFHIISTFNLLQNWCRTYFLMRQLLHLTILNFSIMENVNSLLNIILHWFFSHLIQEIIQKEHTDGKNGYHEKRNDGMSWKVQFLTAKNHLIRPCRMRSAVIRIFVLFHVKYIYLSRHCCEKSYFYQIWIYLIK